MRRPHGVAGIEVGHSACHPDDAVTPPGGEPEAVDRGAEQGPPLAIERRHLPRLRGPQPGVGHHLPTGDAPQLRSLHPTAHRVAGLPRAPLGQHLVAFQARHVDPKVDAVGDGARDTRPIGLGLPRGTRTRTYAIARVPTRARVARAHQQGLRGESRAAQTARDVDAPLLQRLTQRVERRRREGADLVKEKNSEVRQAHLARPRHAPPAHKPRGRDGVVRGPERAACDERAPGRQEPGHGVHPGDGDGLLNRQARQDPRQAPGQHGLAAPGRTDHEN